MDSSASPARRDDGGRFDALSHGLFRRFIANSDGAVILNTRAWNAAAENGDHIGTCRHCGSFLLAQPTDDSSPHIVWYSALCVNRQCARLVAAPNGQILRRSARYTEQPSGYRDQRGKKVS